MSTLGALFDAIPPHAWRSADPNDAAAALAHAARLLRDVGGAPLGRARYGAERARAVAELAATCQTAGSTAVARPSRLGELMAASADQAAVLRPVLTREERWAVTVAALDPIAACAAVLREHAPGPEALELTRRVHRVRDHAAAAPPAPSASSRLDQPLPDPHPAAHSALQAAVDAVERLSHAAATRELTAHDARHASVAGLHIALYARPIETLLTDAGATPADLDACDHAVRLWFATRDAVRSALVGARTPATVELGRPAGDAVLALAAAFGPATGPDIVAAGTPAEVATAYRAITNRLPGLGDALAVAATQWGVPRRQHIDPGQPIPYRDPTGVQRYAAVASTQLDPVLCVEAAAAARQAAAASTVVAAQADRAALRIGTQPHPHLAAAHRHAAVANPPAASRWAGPVDALDARLTTGPDWPALADTLDRASESGYDVPANLPRLIAAEPLPDQLPSRELRYRLIEDCPDAATTTPRAVELATREASTRAAAARLRNADQHQPGPVRSPGHRQPPPR